MSVDARRVLQVGGLLCAGVGAVVEREVRGMAMAARSAGEGRLLSVGLGREGILARQDWRGLRLWRRLLL